MILEAEAPPPKPKDPYGLDDDDDDNDELMNMILQQVKTISLTQQLKRN